MVVCSITGPAGPTRQPGVVRCPKPCKQVSEPVLHRLMANRLRLHGSPEQIAGWLKRTYPEHEKCPGSGHSQLDPDQYPSTHQARFLSPIGEMSRREYISYDIYQMQHILPDSLFAVLANTTRLRSLILLFKHGELCVCDLTEVTGAAQPNISRNLAQMRDTGLLTDRRQGQWVYYQINPDVPAWVTDVLQAVASGTTDLNPYKNDDDVLAEMPTRSDSRRCS